MGDALVALVTGAAGGVGEASARRLAADGHRVAVNDISQMRQRYRDLVPVGQLAATGDIAAAISFLAGPGGSGFVGQVLQPTGGVTRARA